MTAARSSTLASPPIRRKPPSPSWKGSASTRSSSDQLCRLVPWPVRAAGGAGCRRSRHGHPRLEGPGQAQPRRGRHGRGPKRLVCPRGALRGGQVGVALHVVTARHRRGQPRARRAIVVGLRRSGDSSPLTPEEERTLAAESRGTHARVPLACRHPAQVLVEAGGRAADENR